MNTARRQLRELPREESLALLATVTVGRIVFSLRALPAVRLVNHVVDDRAIIVRSHEGAAIVPTVTDASGAVVAYEVDSIDERDRSGWSVIVTGIARLVDDPAAVARYQAIVDPWIAGSMDHVIRIQPEIVTGYRLVPATTESLRIL